MSAREDFAEIVRRHVGAMYSAPGEVWPSELVTSVETPAAEVGPGADATGHTDPTPEPDPAADFATLMRDRLGVQAQVEPEPEPGPRLPAPNMAQGSSGNSDPRVPSAADAFTAFLDVVTGPRNPNNYLRGTGAAEAGQSAGWRDSRYLT